jgi:hypothetical protein
LLIPAAFLIAYLGIGLFLWRVGLELPLWLKMYWSVYVAIMLHVATMGILATLWLKVPIKKMSFSIGSQLPGTNIAAIPTFRILFFSGSVKFQTCIR